MIRAPRHRATLVDPCRAPRHRATLVDPCRAHLRAGRAEDPAVPVRQLLTEIRQMGYPGSMNLPCRYITQGRAEADRPHLSPRRVARLLLTRPEALSGTQQVLLGKLTGACPEMTSLAVLVRDFAALLSPDPANEARLEDWAQTARAANLPSPHAFTRGLGLDKQAVIAAVTLPFHNGRTEGVNSRRPGRPPARPATGPPGHRSVGTPPRQRLWDASAASPPCASAAPVRQRRRH
jgi:hypothetical protein